LAVRGDSRIDGSTHLLPPRMIDTETDRGSGR
jgi:hypothetical protein